MKKIIFVTIIFTSILISCAQKQEVKNLSVLDMSDCNIQVNETGVINNIQTVEGDILKSQEGKTRLVEIKIEAYLNKDGYQFLCYNIPKLLTFVDNNPSVISCIAVGIKFKHHETGEGIAKYHNEATMLITHELEEGEKDVKFSYYAVFELPIEVRDYQLMLPAKISNKVKINL